MYVKEISREFVSIWSYSTKPQSSFHSSKSDNEEARVSVQSEEEEEKNILATIDGGNFLKKQRAANKELKEKNWKIENINHALRMSNFEGHDHGVRNMRS